MAAAVSTIVCDDLTTQFQRTPQVPLDQVPGSLPQAQIPADVDLDHAVQWSIRQLSNLEADNFAKSCVWRDLYALTGLPRSFYGAKQILYVWNEGCEDPPAFRFQLDAGDCSSY